MKNFKRAAAILGVVVLLAVCCLPMIFAFGSGDNAQGNFKAAVGTVILVNGHILYVDGGILAYIGKQPK